MDIEEELYISRDLYLCAFLKARGIRLVKTVKQGKIATFHFERTEDLETLITGFYDNTEMVGANKFVESIKNLKALIYNIK